MLSDLTIQGKQARLVLSSAMHASAELTYSQRQTTNLLLTVVDRPPLEATKALYAHLDEDADCTLGTLILRPDTLTTGGTATHPTVELSFKVKTIAALEKRTGGKSWGNTDVSGWATAEIRAVGGVPLVQPGLGEREIERKEPEGDHERPESSHDVLANMAKQVGAWYYDVGHAVALARPSWLVSQPGMPKYDLVWDDWRHHSESLLSAPTYRVDFNARPWEGRETLTITVTDTHDNGPAHRARPGHIIHYTGKAAPTDPVWIITEVKIPDHHDQPVTITAWRPVDPPEIVPESAEGDSNGEAGVPTGPIGQGGWAGEQLKNAAEIVREGQRRNLPTLAYEIAVMTSMGESSLLNKGYGDAAGPDSCGLFQQRDSWGSRSDRLTPSKAAGFYYKALDAQPYKSNYENGANSLPASNLGEVYIGPGKTARAASVTAHRVQINADPLHYVPFWADAREVVKACINAGKSGGNSPKATGPLGKRIDELMSSYEGKFIDVDGAGWMGNLYQCYDLAQKYLTDLTGIGMIRGDGYMWWKHSALKGKFVAVPANQAPRKGDIASWRQGVYSAYGHVAIYSHTERGVDMFLSQNPGPSRVQPLSRGGVQGWMRPVRDE